VFGETRDRERARPRPRAHDHHVVVERARIVAGEADRGAPGVHVDRLDLAHHELGAAQHPAQRHDDGTRVDQATRHLGQERLVQHEVLGVHQRQLVGRGVQAAFEPACGVHPDVPPADDQDPRHERHPIGEGGMNGARTALYDLFPTRRLQR
jgi:hypothetical protein